MFATLATSIALTCTAPQFLKDINAEINRTPYVADKPHTGSDFDTHGWAYDWRGLDDFLKHGGDCENFATAKCAALWGTPYQCQVHAGYLRNGTPHAWATVRKGGCVWYLDNRFNDVTNRSVK